MSEQWQILLAEDDRINQRIMERFLISRGHTVSSASNGREVLEILATRPFDVVLMDITMPVMDGIEASRTIRGSANYAFDPKIPIIGLSGHDPGDHGEEFDISQMDGFVMKPINFELLLQAIAAAVNSRRQPSAAATVSAPLPHLIRER